MTDRAVDHGPAVIDGELQYTSASAIASADEESDGGCPRKFYYRKVERLPDSPKASAQLGTKCHAEIEVYEKTGVDTRSAIVLAAARFIPRPDPRFGIEHPLADLTADRVPVVGYVDLMNPTGEYIDADGNLERDPPGTIECVDWKTLKDLRYAKNPHQVAATVQMVTYGAWTVLHGAANYRASHVYMRTQGKPKAIKSSLLIPAEEVLRRWNRIEGVVRSMRDYARARCADDVPANTDACRAFGGCAYRDRCSAGREKTLIDLFGAATASDLTGASMTTSLKDLLNLGGASSAPAPATSPVASGPPAEAAATLSMAEQIAAALSMAEQIAALEAEESAAAAPPPPGKQEAPFSEFGAACEAVEAAGKGFPTLSGDAAKAWAAWKGADFRGSGLAGSGMLARLTIADPAKVTLLAKELGQKIAEPPTEVCVVVAPGAVLTVQARFDDDVVAVLPPDAPESDPALASKPAEGAAPDPAAAFVPADKPKRGRPRKSAGDVAVDAAVQQAKATNEAQFAAATGNPPGVPQVERVTVTTDITADFVTDTTAPSDGSTLAITLDALVLYVNCVPSVPCESLDAYVEHLAAQLCTRFGAADLRCAPQESPLGYAKWRGALAALARETPPAGRYTIDTRGRDFHEVVADALASKAAFVVRGIR